MADDINDPEVRRLFEEHRTTTQHQQTNLEARLRALGEEPSGAKGFVGAMLSRAGDLLHRPQDAYDEITQDLVKQYAIEHFEMGMYQSMLAFANTIGDPETAALAGEHLEQERQTADRLWALIEPAAARAGRVAPSRDQAA